MGLRHWGRAALVASLLAGLAGNAAGGNAAAARKQVESSLQVSGTIVIAPDGSVQSHALDPAAPLGDTLTRALGERIGKWRFAPVQVGGKVVTAKVPMHLRLLATPAGEGRINVTIASSYFGGSDESVPTDEPRSRKLTPPKFPRDTMFMGGQGTVYLIVQVGRDGSVVNADTEQVNLRVVGSAREMERVRKSLAGAALDAAKGWQFDIPTTGAAAREDTWLVRVPVDFVLTPNGRSPGTRTGWDSYIPGPRNLLIPWAQEQLRSAAAPDALPGSGVFPLRQGATLLSPPAS